MMQKCLSFQYKEIDLSGYNTVFEYVHLRFIMVDFEPPFINNGVTLCLF